MWFKAEHMHTPLRSIGETNALAHVADAIPFFRCILISRQSGEQFCRDADAVICNRYMQSASMDMGAYLDMQELIIQHAVFQRVFYKRLQKNLGNKATFAFGIDFKRTEKAVTVAYAADF